MRNERRNYLVVGVFVTLMLAALIVWLAALSGRTGATDRYDILWRSVTGLKEGAEVLFDGYPIGTVRGIEPVNADGSGGFRVDVAVRRGRSMAKRAGGMLKIKGKNGKIQAKRNYAA